MTTFLQNQFNLNEEPLGRIGDSKKITKIAWGFGNNIWNWRFGHFTRGLAATIVIDATVTIVANIFQTKPNFWCTLDGFGFGSI